MKKLHALAFVLLLSGNLPTSAQVQQTTKGKPEEQVSSIYTDLSSRNCKLVQVNKEAGDSVQICSGIAGYKLLVEDSDNRMSITIVAPNKKRYALNYWHVITPNFSSLGDKAEWRIIKRNGKVIPLALIVRVNANDLPDPNQFTSYLAVAKITPQGACVTDKIRPGPTANEDARRAADNSASKQCFEP